MPLPQPNNESVLTNTAIRYLSFRPRFRVEVEKRLFQKASEVGLKDPTFLVTKILDTLEDSKFLNDEDLLEKYIRGRLIDRVRGPFWIKARLIRFGLSRATIERAMGDYAARDVQIEVIKKYLERHNLIDPKTKTKLIHRLLGRGFSHEIIMRAFDWMAAAE